ncbi:MAG: PDZ domain-containing protein [Planctomycetes bacterium]|nr:PDZ domain-containing protein [Planctomycetota bacterium]
MDRSVKVWGVGVVVCAMVVVMMGMLGAATARAAEEEHGWLSVDINEVPDDLRAELKLPEDTGVYLEEVHEDGPAAKAGLKNEDVIAAVDGKPAPTVEGFVELIAGHKPGDVLELTIYREKKEAKIKVTLGKRPE